MGRVDQAIVHFKTAVKYQPGYAMADYNLGNAFLQAGRRIKAIVQFKAAIETQPDFAEAHNNLGNVRLQQGQADAAIIHYQKVLELQPAMPTPTTILVTLVSRRGRWTRRSSIFKRL